ncbi:RNA-binding protein AU-1 [Halobiforma haloterrestris]|uniref:Probable ribonuclease FAU-1 n=2 Tax=Natronobacterium haloterrestre TaxID=148448 RepID=A0A1I1DZC3_NATHA|nr:RNA-binding protein AU-1 [Halobiforma haloterrestris]
MYERRFAFRHPVEDRSAVPTGDGDRPGPGHGRFGRPYRSEPTRIHYDTTMTRTTVRVRGIYTTALTKLLEESDGSGTESEDEPIEVVQASDPIEERFDDPFAAVPADIRIETTRDRQGIEVSGAPDDLERVLAELEGLAIDTFRWDDGTPRGAVFDAEVLEAGGGSGAVVDLGDGRRGYLKYDDVDGYVGEGDRYRVQVDEPTPPWDGDEPRVRPTLAVGGGLCTLSRDRTGVSAAASGEAGTELVGMTDLLSTSIPEGWGLRWKRAATDADLEAMETAVERAVDRAEDLEAAIGDAPDEPGEPGRIAAPRRTAWCWFGRESRFALDDHRRAVETTMPGHHRIKAADRAASAAVDFAEAVGASGADGEAAFPFDAVSRQFGPTTGDRLEIGHGKPDGRRISLGYGEVTEWDADGSITLERSMRGGGTYDALGTPKEEGDVAITKFREGRWWYPTTYKSADGETKGTYVNVCTPVELFPDAVRYVDLYVDVIRTPDGAVEIVDADELEAAVDEGLVSEELAEKARNVAEAVERALSK